METLKMKKVSLVSFRIKLVKSGNVKERILAEADRLFCQFGIKSITMEDLAKNLGISKKTIYQHFENKDDLVLQWAVNGLKGLECQWEECSVGAENAIDLVFKFLNSHIEMMVKMNPLIIHDLKKYHPSSVSFLKEYKKHTERERVQELIKQGIREGLYRADLNWDVLARFQLLMKDQCMNQENFPASEFNVFAVVKEVTINFITGLTTLEGHKLVEHYRNATVEQPLSALN